MRNILLVIYSPKDHTQIIKDAAFKAGAGNIGSYSCCAWETSGTGQFMADSQSKPYVGTKNKIHYEPEIRIEMIVNNKDLTNVINAVKKVHPYETPVLFSMEIEQ